MDYAEAIAALKAMENPNTEAITAIESRVGSLGREARSWQKKFTTAEGDLNRLNELVGKDGEDAQKTLTKLQAKITTLTKEKETLTQEKEAAVKSLEDYKAQTTWSEAAIKAGVDRNAFLGLIEGGIIPRDKLEFDETAKTIKVDGKPLAEYAASKGEWVTKALAITEQKEGSGNQSTPTSGNPPVTPPAPTGGTQGSSGEQSIAAIARQTFKGMGYSMPGLSTDT
ncbi:MAG: hypothetical protein F6K14_10750 [Symploca sp. SIO2C1]|nr:hypothetical protein [Symploca sp. SIO2C1]